VRRTWNRLAAVTVAVAAAALAGPSPTADAPVGPQSAASHQRSLVPIGHGLGGGPPKPAPPPPARSTGSLPADRPPTTSPTPIRLPQSQPPAPRTVGATVLGPAPPGTHLAIQVDLRPRHVPALAALAAAVSDPSSPQFRRFLTVGAFRSRFGADPGAVAAVSDYLSAAGLHVGPVAPDGLSVTVSGAESAIARAFSAPMVAVRTAAGTIVDGSLVAPQLPGRLLASVDAVQGLDPWVAAKPTIVDGPAPGTQRAAAAAVTTPAPATTTASGSPSTCTAISALPGAQGPAQLAATYGLNGFWSADEFGQGTTVAVVEFDSFSPSDIASFDQCLGITTSVTVDAPPGATFSGTDSAEPTGDIETLASLAPNASVLDDADSNGTGFGPVLEQAVTASPLPTVVSISWGLCDVDMGAAAERADNVYLAEAAVQGQSVVAASGDTGAEGCGPADPSTVSASYPASSPYVLAVGGTNAATTSGTQATAWDDRSGTIGASGGGLNPYAAQPTWQTSPGTTAYQGSPWCTTNGGSCRAVPDVSAIAQAVYPLYCTSQGCPVAGWQLVGGTSMAAPSWAAALSLAGEQCATGAGLGLVDPLLYQLADTGELPLGMVAAGSNAWYSQGPPGIFTGSGTGYDPVTGLGALGQGGPSLAGGQLCHAPSPLPTDSLPTSPLSLGPVSPGTTATASFTLTTGTAAALRVIGVSVAGSAYGSGSPFSAQLGACGTSVGATQTVPAGGTCTVDVSFSAATDGTYHDMVLVDDNADGVLQEVAVQATVAPTSDLAVSTTSLPFGAVQQDTNQHQQSVRLTNTSTTLDVPGLAATLTVSSSTLSTLPTVASGCGAGLGPGASCTVTVTLDSNQAPGGYQGTLALTAAGATAPSVTLPVTATLTAAVLSDQITPDPVALGTITVGTSASATVTVTDTSATAALGLLSASLSGTGASVMVLTTDDCSDSVLAPGASCSITVSAQPDVAGTLDATLDVPRADGVVGTTTVSADAVSAPSGSAGDSAGTTSSSAGSAGPSGSTAGSGTSGGSGAGSGGGTAGGAGSGGASSSGGSSGSAPAPPAVTRIAGQTADGTAIAVAQALYPQPASASAVVLARDDDFSDALAGGPLAAAVGGPLLVTPGTPLASSLDPAVLAEIERVLVPGGTVDIIGGPLALAPGIDAQLRQAGFVPQRVYGQTQYGTAVAVAELLGNPSTVFEATALDFSDALAAVPAAITAHGAILLTDGNVPDPTTTAYLANHPPALRYAIGGPLAAAGADPAAIAVYGQTAFGTAAAVADRFFPTATTVGVATSTTFTDALAGGVAMARAAGPMLLLPPTGVPSTLTAYLIGDQTHLTSLTVFGGPLAVGDSQLSALLGSIPSPAGGSASPNGVVLPAPLPPLVTAASDRPVEGQRRR